MGSVPSVHAPTSRLVRGIVEARQPDRAIEHAAHGVSTLARAAWRVEHSGLDGLTRWTARALIEVAHMAHQTVEEQGLEGTLRHAVRLVQVAFQGIQRLHTGRLRRNLVWLPVALALAVAGLAAFGW